MNTDLHKYIEDHTTPEDPVLQELRRITFLKATNPRMISGPVLGKFLEMISRIAHPEKILEIGTFTGYGTICLARGLSANGKIISIDTNDELSDISSKFIKKAGLDEKVLFMFNNALDIIPEIPGYFDLIFIDGAKEQYPDYYHAVRNRVSPGGIIIADNTLWDGKVINHKTSADKSTRAIHQFNELVHDDPGFENILLPLRDGLMIIRKN